MNKDHHRRWSYAHRLDLDHPDSGIAEAAKKIVKHAKHCNALSDAYYDDDNPHALNKIVREHYALMRDYKAKKRAYLEKNGVPNSVLNGRALF